MKAAFAIVSANYLPFAGVLADSFLVFGQPPDDQIFFTTHQLAQDGLNKKGGVANAVVRSL